MRTIFKATVARPPISPMQTSDIPEMVGLFVGSCNAVEKNNMEALIHAHRKHSFVAIEDSKITGFVLGGRHAEFPHGVGLVELVAKPDLNGAETGHCLVQAMSEHCRGLGQARMDILTQGNETLTAFCDGCNAEKATHIVAEHPYAMASVALPLKSSAARPRAGMVPA